MYNISIILLYLFIKYSLSSLLVIKSSTSVYYIIYFYKI